MPRFLRRLNDLPVFDPSRWPMREALARIFGTVGVLAFLAYRVLQMPGFPGYTRESHWIRSIAQLTIVPQKLRTPAWNLENFYAYYGYSWTEIRFIWSTRFLVWCLESAILLGYVVAFLTRTRARSVARGFMETVFPFLMAGLPFLIVMSPYTLDRWAPPQSHQHLGLLGAIFALLILGAAINAVGLFTLRRAFTIMSEARVFIRSGIYRFVRHPLYLGHFVTYFGYTLLHFHWHSVALYLLFIGGQSLRAWIEERKLRATFPEYEEYRASTGMFFPTWR